MHVSLFTILKIIQKDNTLILHSEILTFNGNDLTFGFDLLTFPSLRGFYFTFNGGYFDRTCVEGFQQKTWDFV